MQTHNPDVLLHLADLSSDEVFTSPKLANDLLDLLPQPLFSDKNATFLDPVCKSGVFLREIARRLLKGLAKDFPDLQERINHIFTKQLFGIAITELTSLISRRSVYCSKAANGKYSICNQFKNAQGHIFFTPLQHTWKGNACIHCGASKARYDRVDAQESHAYDFIHPHKYKVLDNMKFDVIIGNPPYQLSDEGHGKSAMPIYDKFVLQAKKLNPRYLVMIIPSRWFAGGKGLDKFRQEMLNDTRIKKLVDFWDARDCFPKVDIAGGVCYFLWDREYSGICTIVNKHKEKEAISKRPLNEFDTLVRFDIAVNIIKKVQKVDKSSMSDHVSSRKPFGLGTDYKPSGRGTLTLIYAKGKGRIERTDVKSGEQYIDQWKVITSKTSYDHAGQPDSEGKRRVLSKLDILPPSTVCTETYIILGSFANQKLAENLAAYAKTRFVRFLISQLSFSQDITRERFIFVPQQDYSLVWTDEKLYKKYGLSKEEIHFIESMIRPMD